VFSLVKLKISDLLWLTVMPEEVEKVLRRDMADCRDFLPSRKRDMSSQYRLMTLVVVGDILIPLMEGCERTAMARVSMARINSVPAMGSPCLTPERTGIGVERVLLMSICVEE